MFRMGPPDIEALGGLKRKSTSRIFPSMPRAVAGIVAARVATFASRAVASAATAAPVVCRALAVSRHSMCAS